MKKGVTYLTVACVIMGVAAGASALQVKYTGPVAGQSVNVLVTHPFGQATYVTGVYSLEFTDGGTTWAEEGFCIDLKQAAPLSPQDYSYAFLQSAPAPDQNGVEAFPMGDVKADQIRRLWAGKYSDTMSATEAAGFQATVWEIIFGDVGSGVTFGDSTVDAQVQANLTWLAANPNAATSDTLYAVVSDTLQCFVYDADSGTPPVVPEPVTMVSAFMGLCGIGGYIRRRTLA